MTETYDGDGAPTKDAGELDQPHVVTSVDEERAVVRASARRHRTDAEVIRLRAELARAAAGGTATRMEAILRSAYDSVKAALVAVESDVEAAKDDMIAARALLGSALLVASPPDGDGSVSD